MALHLVSAMTSPAREAALERLDLTYLLDNNNPSSTIGLLVTAVKKRDATIAAKDAEIADLNAELREHEAASLKQDAEIAALRAENERLKLVAEVAKEWATPENFYRLRHRRLLREALEALDALPVADDGWLSVPKIGTIVKADHPITVANPEPTFEVTEVRTLDGRWYVRGEQTMWFSLSLISPPPRPEKPDAEGDE